MGTRAKKNLCSHAPCKNGFRCKNIGVIKLPLPDSHHLEAAEGWLELGNHTILSLRLHYSEVVCKEWGCRSDTT